MKVLALTLALAGLAAAAPVNAQVLSRSRLPNGNTNGTYNDGQWYSVGRDNGGTIYERRTTDSYGNVMIQRARRNSNGTYSIISSRTVNSGNTNNDCTYNRTTNSVGDVIFGRNGSSVSNCNDRNDRRDRGNGGWYPVGNNNGNSQIYERRTRDRNGNVVIQRARRNSNGSFTILNSRTVSNNNGTWDNGRGDDEQGDDRWDNNREDRSNKDWQKEQKRREREYQKGQKEQDKEYRKGNKHGRDD